MRLSIVLYIFHVEFYWQLAEEMAKSQRRVNSYLIQCLLGSIASLIKRGSWILFSGKL